MQKNVQAVPHVMQKNKLFHVSRKKNKLFHMSCKNRAKPCKKQAVPHVAKTMQKPNPHSPPRPCYTCYMCYMGLTWQATEHPLSPGSLLYVLYVLYLTRQAAEHPGFLAICAFYSFGSCIAFTPCLQKDLKIGLIYLSGPLPAVWCAPLLLS